MPEAAKVAQQDAKSVVFYLVKDHWSQSWSMTTGHQQSVGTISCFNVLRFKVFWRGPSAKTCFMSFRISAHC